MKMEFAIRTLAASCVTCLLMSSSLAADPQPTNTTSFDIPFVVETSDGSAAAGSALLFTSVNGGPPEQTQRVPASAGAFHFTAPSDGLYGFAVRMTDASGKVSGEDGPIVPELEVIVDTSAPELVIKLQEIGSGKISVVWISSDSQIAPGSIRLEYAEGADGRWKPIETTPSASGQATINTLAATSVSVRGFVTDLAGNQGTGTSQIVLAAQQSGREVTTAAVPSGGLSIPGNNDYASGSNYSGGGTSYERNSASSMGPTPFSSSPRENAYTGNTASTQTSDYNNSVSVPETSQQTPNSYGSSAYQGNSYSSGNAFPSDNSLPANNSLQANNRFQPTTSYPTNDQFQSNSSYPTNNQFQPNNSYPSDSQGFAGSSYSQNFGPSAPRMSGANSYRPGTASPDVVNNRVFDIAYEVQDVGPSGVGSVELFVTENNGQQWFKYGVDADKQSPFPIDSRGEGTFGFAVRVRNGLGFADPPPQPGEAPSIVVTVDQTPPMANLAQPQIITDARGRVRLQWQVNDAHPDSAPVRLEYAVSASGPWTPVFDWQQDRGGYEMPIQPGMPQTLHFRLLARDAAGNIATAQTPQAVLIDQRRPVARLLRVQPVSAIRRY